MIALRLTALLGAALAGLVATVLGLAVEPAQAQFFDDRFPFFRRSAPPTYQRGPSGFPFFRNSPEPQRPSAPTDNSHAPAPRKTDAAPERLVVVFGDSMADWLSYGLEDLLSETPEIGVLRKHRTHAGLIKYDSKNDQEDWASAIKQTLSTTEKASVVVMMVGLGDRVGIRETVPKTAPETPRGERNKPTSATEFQSERWVELYGKKIDDTIAALRSRGVPVIWVGLPSVRGPKSAGELSQLNDLYKSHAEKAGIVYVDVWDGFVNEAGKYVVFGPDFEGQNRRLRSGDGVHFTKAGALKLAHYVEREIQRVLANRATPMALPGPGEMLAPGEPGGPRPLAGPVLPLSLASRSNEGLLGAAGTRPPPSDPLAMRVLVKGESIAAPGGRADSFAWPPRPFGAEPPVVAAAPPAAVPAATATASAPVAEPAATAAPAPTPAGPAAAPASATSATVAPAAAVLPPVPLPTPAPPAAAAVAPATPEPDAAQPNTAKPKPDRKTDTKPRQRTAPAPFNPLRDLFGSPPRPPAPVRDRRAGF